MLEGRFVLIRVTDIRSVAIDADSSRLRRSRTEVRRRGVEGGR